MTNRAPHVPEDQREEYSKSCFPEAVEAQVDRTEILATKVDRTEITKKPAARKAPAKPATKKAK